MIAAPPGDVFPWLADSARRCRWMGALVESEPLTDGPPERGSRYRDVFEDHGQRIELEAELAEVDAPHRIVVQLGADAFEATIFQQARGGGRRHAADRGDRNDVHGPSPPGSSRAS